jgi:hypothetical protein
MAAGFSNPSTAELETLLAALDSHRGGPGSLAGDLGDPPAFLARIGLAAGPISLLNLLERWRAAGGSRETLLITVQALVKRHRKLSHFRHRKLNHPGAVFGLGSRSGSALMGSVSLAAHGFRDGLRWLSSVVDAGGSSPSGLLGWHRWRYAADASQGGAARRRAK